MVQANIYIPYEPSAKKFQVKSAFSERTEEMEFKGKRIYFWKEITDNYKSIVSGKPWNKSSLFCQSFIQENLPVVEKSSCLALYSEVHTKNHCLEIEFPEHLYRKQSLSSYSNDQMDSMKEFLKMSIGPVLTLEIPTFMLAEKNYYSFRQAMWRLHSNELIKKLNTLKKDYSNLFEANCFSSEQTANANSVIQKRMSDLQRLKSKIQESLAEAKMANKNDLAKIKEFGYCPKISEDSNLTRADKAILSGVAASLSWGIRGNRIWMKKSSSQQREDFSGRVFKMIANFNEVPPSLAKKIGNANMARARKGWGEFYDIGTNHGGIDTDLELMTERGSYQVGNSDDLLAASTIKILKEAGYDTSPFHIGGLQMGICYLVAQHEPEFKKNFYGTEWKTPLVGFLSSRLGYGEYCTGAALGIGLSYTLSKGPKCNTKKPNKWKKAVRGTVEFVEQVGKKAKELINETQRDKQE